MHGDDLTFLRQGRSARTAAILAATYAALAFAILRLDAAPWLMAILALPTLPALWDLLTGPSAGSTLGPDALEWHSGRRTGRIARSEIDRVRLDTRWDFSVRTTVILRSGRKVRLPWEALPPADRLEAACAKTGIPVERHHFQVF